MEPSYLDLYGKGILEKRVKKARKLLENCTLCPRECGINRLEGETGYCRTGKLARIASFSSHFGEESPLVGKNGSGTIFISSCNLFCTFCQNYEISHLNEGVEAEPRDIALMMIQLESRGCHNINFVTPTHVVPQLLEALTIAIEMGLKIPLVYNSGGYDKKETLEILDGVFDIYMPDFKFWEGEYSNKYCMAPDYREVAKTALMEMHRQVGDLKINDMGVAERGLLIRHLVMPNNVSGTPEIMKFIAQEISTDSYINIMDQYRPWGKADKDPRIDRRLNKDEYISAMDIAKNEGLTRLDPRDRIRWNLQI